MAKFIRVIAGLVLFGSLIVAPPAARADLIVDTTTSFFTPHAAGNVHSYYDLSFLGKSSAVVMNVPVDLGTFTLAVPTSTRTYNNVDFTLKLDLTGPTDMLLNAEISGRVGISPSPSMPNFVFISFYPYEQTVEIGGQPLNVDLGPWTTLYLDQTSKSAQTVELYGVFTDSVPEPGIIISFFVMLAGAGLFLWRAPIMRRQWLAR